MFWNKLFDKIYVLSLKECEDRRQHIRKEFAKVGIIDYEFFDASHFASNEVDEFKKSDKVYKFPHCFRCLKLRCACENNFLTDFQIANWHSFVRIWSDIVEKNYKFVLICEDDIVFTPQHKQVILGSFQKNNLRAHNINWSAPLLIGMGGAYHPHKHLVKTRPHLRRQNVMCNPCFCLNQQMAKFFLDNYHVHHTSDHYMHIEVPQKYPFVQHFMMFPWPVYELSFVPSVSKFDSLVRPKGQARRKEYKDFLFLSPSISMNYLFLELIKYMKLPINENLLTPKGAGYRNYYGFFTDYLWKDEEMKKKVKIGNVYMFTAGKEWDILLLKTDLTILKKDKDFYIHLLKTINYDLENNNIENINEELLYEKYNQYINNEFPNKIEINILDLPNEFYLKLSSFSIQKINYQMIKNIFETYYQQIAKIQTSLFNTNNSENLLISSSDLSDSTNLIEQSNILSTNSNENNINLDNYLSIIE